MAVISVKFGQLLKPIRVHTVSAGTTLVKFCEKLLIRYGASIRVNGFPRTRNYVLRSGDLITAIGRVPGGR